MTEKAALRYAVTRRQLLGAAAGVGAMALAKPSWAQTKLNLPLPDGPDARAITTAFPQKGPMILQRTRPPLLETPWDVFDKGVLTANRQLHRPWHWAVRPRNIDANWFKRNVRGHVNQTLALSLNAILHGLPRVEIAAVSQC